MSESKKIYKANKETQLSNYAQGLNRFYSSIYQNKVDKQLRDEQAKDTYKMNMQIRSIREDAKLEAFEQSERNFVDQLIFNQQAEQEALEGEEKVFNERILANAFETDETNLAYQKQIIDSKYQYDTAQRGIKDAVRGFQTSKALLSLGAEQETLQAENRQKSLKLREQQAKAESNTQQYKNRLQALQEEGASRSRGRAGRTVTGAKVYNQEDSVGDKLGKSFAHIVDGILPSIVPIDTRSGEFEASRFARGFVNGFGLEGLGVSSKDRMGRERELSKELARAFSGITENPIESTALKFKGYEYAESRKNASNIFTTVSNRSNTTPQDFINAYTSASEAQFRVQSRMFNVVEDMKLLGMTKPQIRRVFKKAGIGGIDAILRGQFDPIDISPTVRKNARDNELDIPRKEINRLRNEYRNLPLGSMDPPTEPQVEETPTLDLEPVSQAQPVQQPQQVAATLAPPGVAQAGPTTAPSVGPASSTTTDPATLAAIIPNPRDQVLAARLRGTA